VNGANRIGVLLLQLGTPDAPTAKALRPYLRQFLGDPRVIEPSYGWERYPRLWRCVWWCVLNGIILLRRPAKSAEKYRRIWRPETGMPLLHYTRRQAEELQKILPPGMIVRFGMRYGNPGTAEAVRELLATGVDRIVVLPMYPQYSGTTTGSALDALFQALQQERCLPAIRIVPPYHEHPAYLDAMAQLIREQLASLSWQPDYYLLSFHGIPQAYVQRGDPYALHVERTAQALAKRLNWPRGTWARTYQSLFGEEEWLKPYTEEKLRELAKHGVKRVFVATPGFTADCLETIDEVGYEIRLMFEEAGGERLHRCPCLNDHPQFIQALRVLVMEEASGWITVDCQGDSSA
jgi:ferrochelatase